MLGGPVYTEFDSVPVNQPLDALVSRFEEEVRAEAGEEERDAGVQLLVDLFGLDAAFYSQRGPAEQRVLEFQERRFDSQQLLQPCAAWRTKVRLFGSETGQRQVWTFQIWCRTHRGRRRCFCPWKQHLWGQRGGRRPLCVSAGWGHSEAAQASSADEPMTS